MGGCFPNLGCSRSTFPILLSECLLDFALPNVFLSLNLLFSYLSLKDSCITLLYVENLICNRDKRTLTIGAWKMKSCG